MPVAKPRTATQAAQPAPKPVIKSTLPPLPQRALPPLPTPAAAAPTTKTAEPDKACKPAESSAPDGVLWKKLLDCMERTHPMLHHYLAGAHIEFTSRQEWKALFANKFSCQSAMHNSASITALLKEVSGRDIKLSFGEGAPKQQKTHFEEVSATQPAQEDSAMTISDEEPLSEPAAVWQDIDTPPDPSEDPAVRRVVKLFHGKVIKQPGDEKH